MKIFNKVLLAATLSSAVMAASAQADTIRVAIEGDYRPFNYMDSNNKVQGFDVDITNALCAKMNAKCNVVIQEWDGMIPGLVSKKYDAIISSMTVTEERAKVVGFSNHYYKTTLAVAVAKDSNIKNTTPEAFKGKVIGVQSSTTQGAYAENIYGKAGAEVKFYSSQSDVNNELEIGRIDAMVHDIYPLLGWLNTSGKDCCKMLGKVGKSDDVSIALRKDDSALRERFNKAIDAIRADGSYQKIVKKYFGDVDVYN